MVKYIKNIKMPNGDILTIPETDISNCATTDLDNITEAGKEIIRKNSGSGFNLFDTKVVDHILQANEAVGWLLQGSLVTMVYPDAVNKIKELYEGGSDTTYREIACKMSVDGRYIADISQKEVVDNLFETTGIADFYILDSANNQFYLPRSKWFHQFTLDTSLVNNYNEAGLPNITGTISRTMWRNNRTEGVGLFVDGCFKLSKQLPGGGNLTSGVDTNTNMRDTAIFDASRSSSIYGNSDTVQPPSSNKLLYYKVGDVVINETSIDVAEVLNEIQTKLDIDHSNDTKPYITETYVNGTSGYVVYSNGLCEQWGRYTFSHSTAGTVAFLKAFKDNNYSISANSISLINATYNDGVQFIYNLTASSFTHSSYRDGNATWRAIGYIS